MRHANFGRAVPESPFSAFIPDGPESPMQSATQARVMVMVRVDGVVGLGLGLLARVRFGLVHHILIVPCPLLPPLSLQARWEDGVLVMPDQNDQGQGVAMGSGNSNMEDLRGSISDSNKPLYDDGKISGYTYKWFKGKP